MFIKKKLFVGIGALLLAFCTLFLSSCTSIFVKKLSDQLPGENVTSIEMVTKDVSTGEETRVTLSADKIDTFMGIVGVLEYVKDYNIRGLKYIPFDEVEYEIIYETYKVVLSEHLLTIYKDGEWLHKIRVKSIEPIGKYNALSALFNE